MSGPLVSIVIPCFNAQAYVAEAVRSALDQTYGNTEVILVDDGSTDGSLEVVRSFGDRVRWQTGPNRGGSAARNLGLKMARGELIQFLDADDILRPEKLERQVPVLLETGKDMVLCDWELLGPGRAARRKPARPAYAGEDPLVYVLGGRLPIEAPLHRKEVLAQVGGFREDLPCAQEFDLHVRMAAAGCTMRHVPEVLFAIREVEGSVSDDYLRVLDQFQRILGPVCDDLRGKGALTLPRARAFAAAMARAGRHALQRGNRRLGVEYIRLARSMHAAGAAEAYAGASRWLYAALGPVATEWMVGLKRRLAARGAG